MGSTCSNGGVMTRRLLLTSFSAIAVTGCAMDRSPKTTDLRFLVEADDLINPNTDNVASPLVLRIYELRQLSAFMGSSLFELLDSDTTVLGQDLVAKREIEIRPGEKLNFDRSTPIETRYVGVIAGFRTLDAATWRTSTEIKPERSGLIVVKLTAQTVTIQQTQDQSFGFF